MAQSVELLLDEESDVLVRREWELLHRAGLPSERRSPADLDHRPHLTLYASDALSEDAERALPPLVAGLSLRVQLGALMLFGPHRGRHVLVHQVVPTVPLLLLQEAVARACRADPEGHFAPGHWTPHITVARRVESAVVGPMLEVLAPAAAAGRVAYVSACRRWDGTLKRSWLL